MRSYNTEVPSPAAAPLIFRSRSGRTEVTRLPDGSLDIRVLTGKDILDPADRDRLLRAVGRRAVPRRSLRCRVGWHRWHRTGRSTWACARCQAVPKPCTNCGGQHNPDAAVVTCTVAWEGGSTRG